MDIVVISGFLGAGKTTFITELVRHAKGTVAVFENELGDVGVDKARMEEDMTMQEKPNIWELTEGCICCSLKGDFRQSVLTIANAVDPALLIIEPTGVGLLSSVMDNLSTLAYERIRLLAPVTIVDALNFTTACNEYGAIAEDQIHHAGHLVISKTAGHEQATAEVKAALAQRGLQEKLLPDAYTLWTEDIWQSILTTPYTADGSVAEVEAPALETMAVPFASFGDIAAFHSAMRALMEGRFGDVYRAKGTARIGSIWGRFDIVGTICDLTAVETKADEKAVIIGRQLDKDAIALLFRQ